MNAYPVTLVQLSTEDLMNLGCLAPIRPSYLRDLENLSGKLPSFGLSFGISNLAAFDEDEMEEMQLVNLCGGINDYHPPV